MKLTKAQRKFYITLDASQKRRLIEVLEAKQDIQLSYKAAIKEPGGDSLTNSKQRRQ